jgi:LemA protein
LGITLLIAVLVLAAVAAIALFLWMERNRLVVARHEVDRAWSSLEQALKARNDEVPKVLGLCRAYLHADLKELKQLSDARNAILRSKSPQEKYQASQTLRSALQAALQAAQSNAELKKNTAFQQLQARLAEMEGRAVEKRDYFNQSVAALNKRMGAFPGNLLVPLLKIKPGIPV